MKLRVYNSRFIYVFLSIIVISIPLISTFFMVTFYLHKQLLNYTPQWSDEIYYWHQVATFRLANFNGGYYTVNELPAPASFFHFYAWGPIYPILFGTLAKIIGWKLYYAPLLNIVIFSLVITWYIITTKPNYLQLLLIGLILLTFWPLQLYMATNMLVVIDCSFAIVLAIFFYKTIKEPEDTSRINLIIFFSLICLMAMLKVSWAILFLPYLLIIRHKIRLSILQATIASTVLIAISYFVYGWISAPFPNSFNSTLIETLKLSIFESLRLLAYHLFGNIRNFFDITQDPLFLMVRAQMLLVLIFSGYLLWKRYKDNSVTRESIVVITSCLLLIISNFLLYDVGYWRDFRLFTPLLLMSILFLIARKRISIVLFIIVLNLLLLPSYFYTYKDLLVKSFPDNSIAIHAFTDQISSIVKYDKSKGAWDNTLLIPISILDNRLLGVPAGIGLSWFRSPDAIQDIKSRYLILDQYDYERLKNRRCLEFMVSTDIGDLYINQGADCYK